MPLSKGLNKNYTVVRLQVVVLSPTVSVVPDALRCGGVTGVFELQHHGIAGQFILTSTGSGKMFHQMLRHRLNAADYAAFVVRLRNSRKFASDCF